MQRKRRERSSYQTVGTTPPADTGQHVGKCLHGRSRPSVVREDPSTSMSAGVTEKGRAAERAGQWSLQGASFARDREG